MREIKFRGRIPYDKGWVYGDLRHIGNNLIYIVDKFGHGSSVNPETVGQFTGLRDSNGRDIYEGDVVQSKELLFPYDTGVIRYCGEFTSFYLDTGDGDINDLSDDEGLTVLGNVHDNPELLEATHD